MPILVSTGYSRLSYEIVDDVVWLLEQVLDYKAVAALLKAEAA